MNEVFKIDHPLFKEINTKFLKMIPTAIKKILMLSLVTMKN